MKKLSKTALLVLGVGILVIAFGSLYMLYSRERGEQQQLDASLLVVEATLPKLVLEKENGESQLTQLDSELTQLESELTQATSLLAESKTSFPELVESIEYDEKLFEIADDWGLEIMSLTASESTDEEVGNITYSVTYFTVVVQGEVAAMLNFINTIKTDEYFITATVEEVAMINMNVLEPLSEDEETEEPSATINLVIYGYRGE